MISSTRAGVFAALLALCAAPAAAQTAPAPSPTPSTAPEIGRVSTSDRQDEPVSSTARVTYVVTKADIVRHNYTTVGAALEGLPGVSVQRYGNSGAQIGVTIRGSSSGQVLVLLDGHPVSGAQNGTLDLGGYPTNGVERIEVVEGSGATLYGSGAVAGVINIITSRTKSAYRTPLVVIDDGSFGERRVSIDTGIISFERHLATNNYDYPAIAGAPAGTRTNADLASTNLRLTDSAQLGAVRISGSVGLFTRDLGVPGSTSFLTASARQDEVDTDARVGLAYTHGRATTSLDLTGTRGNLVFRDADPNDGGPYLDNNADARVQASLRNVVATEANRLVYGLDLAHGSARNDAGGGLTAVTPYAQTALYVQDSLQVARGSRVYAGLRGERDGGLGGALTPSVGGIVAIGEGLSLRANAATAFRVPTAEDLYYPGFSNPLLQPERTRSFDVSLNDANILGGLDIGYFVQTGSNLIVVNPLADYSVPFGPGNEAVVNAQRASIAGLTLGLTTKPFHDIVTTFNLTDTYRALDFEPGTDALRLANRPVITAHVDVGYTGAPRATLAALGVVAQNVGQRDLAGAAAAYTRVDAYARVRVTPAALLSLRVYNLGNERYADFAGYPAPGRAFGIELSTR